MGFSVLDAECIPVSHRHDSLKKLSLFSTYVFDRAVVVTLSYAPKPEIHRAYKVE